MSDAPKRLYLQTHDNPNDEFAWTHADHRIHDDDTEYVRVDEIERLEAALESIDGYVSRPENVPQTNLQKLISRIAREALNDL